MTKRWIVISEEKPERYMFWKGIIPKFRKTRVYKVKDLWTGKIYRDRTQWKDPLIVGQYLDRDPSGVLDEELSGIMPEQS